MTDFPSSPPDAAAVHPDPASVRTDPARAAPTRAVKPVRRRSRRWLIVLPLLLLAAGAGVLLVQRGSAAPGLSYPTDVAAPGTVSVLVSGPGTLIPRASVPDPAPASGTVSGLPAVGTVVKAGQVIGQLRNDSNIQAVQDAQLALQKAQAQLSAQRASQAASQASRSSGVTSARLSVQDAQDALKIVQSTLAGQQRLYAVGGISRNDLGAAQTAVQSAANKLASAQAALSSASQQASTGGVSDSSTLQSLQLAVDGARATLEQAQQTVAKGVLRAPVGGVITGVDAVNGSNVNAGTSLLTIADTSMMELPVQIDETQISQVKPSLLARAALDALDGQTVEGKVTSVSPTAAVQNNISVFTVNVELPNPDGLLRAGMSAQSDIVIAEQSGLVVPAKAIQAVRTRSYVQVLPASTLQNTGMLAPATGSAASTTAASQSSTQSAPQLNDRGAATAVQTRVQVGLSDGTSTIVTGGLQPGDALLLPAAVARSTRSTTGSGIPGINLGTGGAGGGGSFRGGNP